MTAVHRRASPPRAALWMLRALLPRSEREFIVGDLVEDFDNRVGERGAGGAVARFWLDTFVACVLRRPRVADDFETTNPDPTMHSFLADLRHGVRTLRRAPGFAALSVGTLALAIGATTAIFSVANPILLRPLPYPDPGQLVAVWERDAQGSKDNTTFATFTDIVHASKTLQRATVLGSWEPTLTDNDDGERVVGERVSWMYFSVLGVRPAQGRDFAADEDVPDKNAVVILSHALWQRRYHGDSAIAGRTIGIYDKPYLVAGVLPASFDDVLSPGVEIYRVLGYDTNQPWACRTCRHLRMIGRIRAEVPRIAATAELNQLVAALAAEHPKDFSGSGAIVTDLREQVTSRAKPVLLAVLGAVALVLLIAVANVTNLQLARSIRREGEFAIRTALGAGRARLTQQLLAEGLVVATLAGTAGVVIANSSLGMLVARLPSSIPRLASVSIDGGALFVTACITLTVGIVVGLAPAWHAGRGGAFAAIRAGGRGTTRGRHRARAVLVIGEVAVALLLTFGAGLLGRSLVKLLSVDSGVEASHLLTLEVQATGARYREKRAVWANHDQIRDAVRALPGVTAVGVANQLPLGGNVDAYGIRAQDKPLSNPELAPSADRYVVTPDFIGAMGIPMLRGRGFTANDDRDSVPAVAIVSAALATRIWPGEDAIGKRIQIGAFTSPWREVVGVAGNVRHQGLDVSRTYQFYIPQRQWEFADNVAVLVVRASGDPASIAPAVRSAVRGVDRSQPVMKLATMQQVITASTSQRRLALVLFAAFASLALLLAGAGIYGVLAGAVNERTREIGLRSALGAAPRDILAMVLTNAAGLAGTGLAIGVGGALIGGQWLESLLFGIRPTDPVALVGVALVLGLIALVASAVPAWRALRIDPMEALRAD